MFKDEGEEPIKIPTFIGTPPVPGAPVTSTTSPAPIAPTAAPVVPPVNKAPAAISEIDKALKEFEAQSDTAPQVQVSPQKAELAKYSGMVRLIMKLSGGAIKTQKAAEYVLLVCSILFFLLSFYFFFGSGGNKAPQISPAALQQMKQPPAQQ